MDTGDLEPTQAEILEAAHRALSKRGYSDLTIRDIAEEFEKSKSLLYYHYDGKEALFADLLSYASETFITELQLEEATPRDQLVALVDRLLPATLEDDQHAAHVALLELRSQVPHVDVYATQFTEIDREFTLTVRDIIQDGIERGQFQERDAEREAELFVSLVDGMRIRRLTSDRFSVTDARETLGAYLEDRLFAPHEELPQDGLT